MCGEDPGILLQFSYVYVVQHGVCLLFSTNIYHTLPKIATEIFLFSLFIAAQLVLSRGGFSASFYAFSR